jgi:hypothetical protein
MKPPLDPGMSLESAAQYARDAAASLAENQRDGVELAREERDYKRKPPPSPWWIPLAEMALTLASSGLSAYFAKLAGPFLAHLMSSAAKKDSALAVILTDGIKDGLKLNARTAIAAGSKAVGPSKPDPRLGPSGTAGSTDPAIDFFDRQRAACNSMATANRNLVTSTKDKIGEHVDARTGVAILQGITAAFTEAAAIAKETQVLSTESQWVAGISQASGKTEDLSDGRTVTALMNHADRDGVLHIDAVATWATKDGDLMVDVRGARITGVAQTIEDRFWNVPLDTLSLPIELHVQGPGFAATIWRDEARRVFSQGSLPVFRQGIDTDPTQTNRGATTLIELVTRQSLAGWGVERVETDDENIKNTVPPVRRP